MPLIPCGMAIFEAPTCFDHPHGRYASNNTMASNWNLPSFTGDASWKSGLTRMGYGPDLGGVWNTLLPDSTVALRHYFRTTFCLSATRLAWLKQQQLQLKVMADNGADVYINGVSLLQDSASNHDVVYWNNVLNVLGNSSIFVAGEGLMPTIYLVCINSAARHIQESLV